MDVKTSTLPVSASAGRESDESNQAFLLAKESPTGDTNLDSRFAATRLVTDETFNDTAPDETSSRGAVAVLEDLSAPFLPFNLPLGATTPENLPTAADIPSYMMGHEVEADFISNSWEDEYFLKDLEDYAHRERVLLSSDALRYLIRGVRSEDTALAHLGRAIAKAKAAYPSEDGWLALNLSRLEELDKSPDRPMAMTTSVSQATLPAGNGSVAEAILTGNLQAALHLIEDRPMVSLADATADLDAVYRSRKAMPVGKHPVSELLKQEADKLTLEQLGDVINALTSAIDGTYSDERSAVKTAIIKAVKVVA